jgi:hypothetical protein
MSASVICWRPYGIIDIATRLNSRTSSTVRKCGLVPELYSAPMATGTTLLAQLVDGEAVAAAREGDGGAQHEVIVEFQRQMRIVGRTHDFMQFFARADADTCVAPDSAPSRLARSVMRTEGMLRHENLTATHAARSSSVRNQRLPAT